MSSEQSPTPSPAASPTPSGAPVPTARPVAVVTGASSGIGLELARCAVRHGYYLLLAADTPLDDAVAELRDEEPAARRTELGGTGGRHRRTVELQAVVEGPHLGHHLGDEREAVAVVDAAGPDVDLGTRLVHPVRRPGGGTASCRRRRAAG